MARNGKTSEVPTGQNGIKLIRFSDEDLREFEILLLEKRETAFFDYKLHRDAAINADSNDTHDTSPGSISWDDAAAVNSQLGNSKLANRQATYIKQIDDALFRVRVKTFGVCNCEKCEGKVLIQKERLRAVPISTKCCGKINGN